MQKEKQFCAIKGVNGPRILASTQNKEKTLLGVLREKFFEGMSPGLVVIIYFVLIVFVAPLTFVGALALVFKILIALGINF